MSVSGHSCISLRIVHIFGQAQKRRAGKAHVSSAGEQARVDGPVGRSHETAKGITCFRSAALFCLLFFFYLLAVLSFFSLSLIHESVFSPFFLLADRMKSRRA